MYESSVSHNCRTAACASLSMLFQHRVWACKFKVTEVETFRKESVAVISPSMTQSVYLVLSELSP